MTRKYPIINHKEDKIMKRIINRKKYDTETATAIASYDNGLGPNDFNNFNETLYKKKTGEFFLAGNGGPMTKYAHNCSDNTRCGGSGIFPLTLDEAKNWVENHANSKYEEIFGEVDE